MMNDMDSVPVKERHGGIDSFNRQRQVVNTWSREDIEDKYLRMYEENINLKRFGKKQEENIKRMATKLIKLANDKKKLEQGEKLPTGTDVKQAELIDDLRNKVRDLDARNKLLKEKLAAAKQLTVTQAGPGHYDTVNARINTGLSRTGDKLFKTVNATPPRPKSAQNTMVRDDYLEKVVRDQKVMLSEYAEEIRGLEKKLRDQEIQFEEKLNEIQHQAVEGHRMTVMENVDMIKLQRQMREKTEKLEHLQEKYETLQKKFEGLKTTHYHLESEMALQRDLLKEEQDRVVSLQKQLKSESSEMIRKMELELLVQSQQQKIQELTDASNNIENRAAEFDLGRKTMVEREHALKVQIAQLEAVVASRTGQKADAIDRIIVEREERDQLEKELSEAKIQCYTLKQELEETKEKMKYFSRDGGVDFTELEEALVLVKQKKQEEEDKPSFLETVEIESKKDMKKEYVRVQAEYADTIHELEKTRNMLIVQHNINKDYQNELSAVTRKMEDNKTEYETKLDEYARLLDIRAARIKKLEHQMKDVAYGTKQFRIKPDPDAELSDADDVDDTVSLERGENLFEIHISKVALTPEALAQLEDDEPVTFCTWEFFEFELQATALLKGTNPKYDFTSQYVVKVDDFFLHYLQKETATLELHQALGTDHRTMAACQLSFRDIFDKPHGRIHGTAQLLGVNSGTGVNFGVLEYWVRLRVPVDQALRLYKERTKALGYISSNIKATEEALLALEDSQRASDNVNQLHIKLIRCTDIEARREGLQPSAYAVYKFFDFPDHDTTIIPSSNQPEFQDRKVYPVTMTTDVDRYLKSQSLQVYVFDDTETDDSAYLGMACVPLITLAHDKPVKGTYDLKRADGTQNGTIDVQLKWQFSYIPPRGATRTAAQALVSGPADPQPGPSVALMPGENLDRPYAQLPPKSAPKTQPEPFKQPTVKPRPSATKSSVVRRSEPPSPVKSTAGSPRDEVKPAVAALAAEAPVAARRGSASSVRSREEEIQAIEQRPVPPKRPKATVEGTREEGLATLERSLVVEEEGQIKDVVPPRLSMDEVNQQLEKLTHAQKGMKKDKKKKKGKKIELDDDTGVEESIEEDLPAPPVRAPDVKSGGESSVESDSEGLIIQGKTKNESGTMKSDTVTITIFSLMFDEGSSVMDDDNIKLLYVEYRFLMCPPDELETPYALPKPEKPDLPVIFNFSKVFHVDMESHYEKRQLLASMLLPDDEEQGKIRFTVVSEPADDNQEAECEDVGVAFVSMKDILQNQADLVERSVPVFSAEDESTVIGGLTVTVEALEALRAVNDEMNPDPALDKALSLGDL